MKALIWILLVLLVAIFATVFVQQILHHSPADEKDYEGMAAARDLRVYELLSFAFFLMTYYLLCRKRLDLFDPLLRLITAALLTIVVFTMVFWWAMATVFHGYRPEKSLPFECFLAAFWWSIPTIVMVVLIGCLLNALRVHHVGR